MQSYKELLKQARQLKLAEGEPDAVKGVADGAAAGSTLPDYIKKLIPVVLAGGTVLEGADKFLSPEKNVYTQAAMRRAKRMPYVLPFDQSRALAMPRFNR